MNKKIIFSVMMLLLVFVLVSCGKKPKVEDIYIDNATGNYIVEAIPTQNHVDYNIKYYERNNRGQVTLKEISSTPSAVEALDNNIYKLSYPFSIEGQIVYRNYYVYHKQETVSKDVVMTILDLSSAKLVYQQGQTFDAEGIKAVEVLADGTTVKYDTVSVDPNNNGHEIIVGKDYFQGNASATLLVNGESIDFNYVVYGGEKPISIKTAKWHNWVFLQVFVTYLMSFIGSITGNSLAIAILLTTIIVRTLAWPIYAKSNDLSMKMSLAQPDMQRVQNKYATRKDPESQQKMQMEMMQVYKKHNINMFGCLMPFLQMPIFIAMYNNVRRLPLEGGQFTESVSRTMFLGIDLASAQISWANYVFAALVGITMFILQKISQKKPSYAKNTGTQVKTPQAEQTERTMKMVSYFMIFMMVAASFSSISIAFYWIIGNVYSLGQTMLNRYLSEKKYIKMQQSKLIW